MTIAEQIKRGAGENRHTQDHQYSRFMAWKSDYIVRFEPMIKQFIRAGCPLGMEAIVKVGS